MKKTYKAIVRSRSRITIPYDCWMDARCSGLKLRILGDHYTWCGLNMSGMTPSMSYRVTVPFAEGTEVKLIPVAKEKLVHVKKIGPYEN